MKSKMFCVLGVLALVTVSFAQKPQEVMMSIVVTGMEDGWPVEIHLSVMNSGSKSVTLREVELYCGTSDHKIWESIATYPRVTVKAGEQRPYSITYSPACANDVPSCAGDWSIQGWMCFSGSGKSDLMTPLIPFTVNE
jgi:hypothetical protein